MKLILTVFVYKFVIIFQISNDNNFLQKLPASPT